MPSAITLLYLEQELSWSVCIVRPRRTGLVYSPLLRWPGCMKVSWKKFLNIERRRMLRWISAPERLNGRHGCYYLGRYVQFSRSFFVYGFLAYIAILFNIIQSTWIAFPSAISLIPTTCIAHVVLSYNYFVDTICNKLDMMPCIGM